MMLEKALLLVLFCAAVEGGCITDGRCSSLKGRIEKKIFKTVCYPHLGCFYTGPPFYHPILSPIPIPPQSPEKIKVRFFLFTRRNRHKGIEITEGNLKALQKSPFQSNAVNRFIIPGYADNVYITRWILRLKDAFLDAADDNVFYVDWTGGNFNLIPISIANTRVTGAVTANFINFLCRDTGILPEKVHVVGHSLGAQIAGYVGQRVKNLGRITGLDPAGITFNFMPAEVALDPTDALFVDAIHSNPGLIFIDGFGSWGNVGDVDFWPWNGKNPKPLCANRIATTVAEAAPLTEIALNVLNCRHLASYEYFIYSFNQNNCLFVGVLCRSWDDFKDGQCDCGEKGERCDFMGYYAKPPKFRQKEDRYYLETALQRPYCVHQYIVEIFVRNFLLFEKHVSKEYTVDVSVSGHKSSMQKQLKLRINHAKMHQNHRFLLTSEKPLHNVIGGSVKLKENIKHCGQSVEFEALRSKNCTSFTIDKIKVTYLYPLPRSQTTSYLCKTPDHFKQGINDGFTFTQASCYFQKF